MPPLTSAGSSGTGTEKVPTVTQTTWDTDQAAHEAAVAIYGTNRLYYSGEQYEAENQALADQAGYTQQNRRLPEHLRKHAYSSHIQESIDILSDQLAQGIQFDGTHADLLNQWWLESEMNERADDWFREALILGDVYGVPDWDPVDEIMKVDVWEGEAIWPVYAQDDWRKLTHWYRYGTVLDDQGMEHDEVRIYVLEPTGQVMQQQTVVDPELLQIEFGDEAPELYMVQQVVEYVYVDDQQTERNELRLPVHPLAHARGDTRRRLRSRFGDSLITKKVRGSADRYNAISQLGFRVARQNSFATIAVVGDAANLGAGGRNNDISKDIADVLTFPGGTNVSTVSLPTDPRMIEQQLHQLERNLYREFGLTKTDISEFGGLGTVSGYALEIMNRKDRATQDRIRNAAIAGIRALANRMLDVHAVRSAEAAGMGDWWSIDPQQVYPDREGIEIVIASGDVVDSVSDRDDFTTGLVSRRYVLRRRGLGSTEIDTVETEINEQAQQQADLQVSVQTQTIAAQAEEARKTQAEQAAAQAKTQQTVQPTGQQTGTTQRSAT